ncbi:MAG: hypothetical protein KDE48_03825 [Anaerolineales bacterium]|nr:hypothetical protein [Anaerolineales bacterium]
METNKVNTDLLYQPITVLDVGLEVQNPLKRVGIVSVNQVVELGHFGITRINNVGEKRANELFSAISNYLGTPVEQLQQYIIGGLLPSTQIKPDISNEIKALPISELGIHSNRVLNSLERAEIKTIDDLLPELETNFKNISGLGKTGIAIIIDHLESLLSRMETPDTHTSQLKRLLASKTPVIGIDPNSRPNLVTLILPFTEAIMDIYGDKRGFKYIKYYYGLHGKETYTLQDIGDAEGITRERVRQINAKTLLRIRETLLGQKLLKDWFVPNRLVEEANELLHLIQTEGDFVPFKQILHILGQRYKDRITPQQYNLVKFLLVIFEFKELPQNVVEYHGSRLDTWQTNKKIKLGEIWPALKAVYRTLQTAVLPISFFEIKIRVNRKRKKKIDGDYIVYAIAICPDVENLNDDLFQISFDKLTSVANQAYRVLHTNQKPMHFRDILKEINHQLTIASNETTENHPVPQRTLIGQLVDDNRFNPIGKSGRWTLSEWDHVVTQTTVEIMEEFFHRHKSSATVEEIHEYVVTKRPRIPKNSIIAYLYEKKEFIRVSDTDYELATWGAKPYQSKRKRKNVQNDLVIATRKLFSSQTEQRMLQSELLKTLHMQTDIPISTITAWLYRTPLIRLEALPTKKRRNIAIFIDDVNSPIIPNKPHKTLMQIVQQEVVQYLKEQPQYMATVADTAIHVMNKTNCKKHTFYNYLDRIENISKEKQGNTLYCFLKNQENFTTEQALQFTQISTIRDKKLREDIERAVALLNVQTVDVGLFQLGKIFENELKALLQKAKAVNAFQVTRNDLSRLANMIDCVTRENIIQRKHRLTFLRQERNERAHGNILEREEREKLMQDAPFLAGSYIDHIIVFHKKRIDLS